MLSVDTQSAPLYISTNKNGQPMTPPYYGPLSPPLKAGLEGSTTFADLLDEAIPTPPPSFADIMKSFSKDGNGDVNTLLAILNAKQAEEDRLAKTLEIRIHLLQMHAHRLGMVPAASNGPREVSPLPNHRLHPRSRDASPRASPYSYSGSLAPRQSSSPRDSPSSRPGLLAPPMVNFPTMDMNRKRSSSSSSGSSGSMVESRSLPSLSNLPTNKSSFPMQASLSSSSSSSTYPRGPQLAPISPKAFATEVPTGSKRKLSNSSVGSIEDDLTQVKRSKRTDSSSDQASSPSSNEDAEARWRSRSGSDSTSRANNGLEMLLNAANAEVERK